jgi:hypothetical protein
MCRAELDLEPDRPCGPLDGGVFGPRLKANLVAAYEIPKVHDVCGARLVVLGALLA